VTGASILSQETGRNALSARLAAIRLGLELLEAMLLFAPSAGVSMNSRLLTVPACVRRALLASTPKQERSAPGAAEGGSWCSHIKAAATSWRYVMLFALALTARWENMAPTHSPLPAETVKPVSTWIGSVRKMDARAARPVCSPRRAQRDARSVQRAIHLCPKLHSAQYVRREHMHPQSHLRRVHHALQVRSVPKEPARV
jgi:hypothetical protein